MPSTHSNNILNMQSTTYTFPPRHLTEGACFAGWGGTVYGAKLAGVKTEWTIEIDPLNREFLQYQAPDATHYEDIRHTRPDKKVDIVTAGFPCQDISSANSNAQGLTGPKSSLFWEAYDIICRLRPRFVVLENSPMLLHRGLSEILPALAALGYDAEWDVISCKQFGHPHLRKRLFVVAYANSIRQQAVERLQVLNSGKISDQAYPDGQGEEKWFFPQPSGVFGLRNWIATLAEFSRMDDGLPKRLGLRLCFSAGNSVSPLIMRWIFERIKVMHSLAFPSEPLVA